MKVFLITLLTIILFLSTISSDAFAEIAVLGIIGEEGEGDGKFKNPYGIAIISNDDIYVSDFTFDNIQAFDSSGNFLLKWGQNGPEEGNFERVYGMDSDKFDNIYVADTFNHRVQVFDYYSMDEICETLTDRNDFHNCPHI